MDAGCQSVSIPDLLVCMIGMPVVVDANLYPTITIPSLPLTALISMQRVEQEVGQREVTVRELFRSASLLAANKPVVHRNASRAPHPPSLPASPGKGSHNGDAAV